MLDFQKDFAPIKEVEEKPAYGDGSHFRDEGFPPTQVVDEPVDEDVAENAKIEEAVHDVDGDRIGPDDREEEGPPLMSPDIDDPVKEGQQQKAPAAREENEGA
jgi:hypothetical protein